MGSHAGVERGLVSISVHSRAIPIVHSHIFHNHLKKLSSAALRQACEPASRMKEVLIPTLGEAIMQRKLAQFGRVASRKARGRSPRPAERLTTLLIHSSRGLKMVPAPIRKS